MSVTTKGTDLKSLFSLKGKLALVTGGSRGIGATSTVARRSTSNTFATRMTIDRGVQSDDFRLQTP